MPLRTQVLPQLLRQRRLESAGIRAVKDKPKHNELKSFSGWQRHAQNCELVQIVTNVGHLWNSGLMVQIYFEQKHNRTVSFPAVENNSTVGVAKGERWPKQSWNTGIALQWQLLSSLERQKLMDTPNLW